MERIDNGMTDRREVILEKGKELQPMEGNSNVEKYQSKIGI